MCAASSAARDNKEPNESLVRPVPQRLNPRINLREYPQPPADIKKPQADNNYVFGDAHGNVLKVIAELIYYRILELKNPIVDYPNLVKIFDLHDRMEFDTAAFKANYSTYKAEFAGILARATLNPCASLTWIGDLLADRRGSIFLILQFFEAISIRGVPCHILISNHDMDFILWLENPKIDRRTIDHSMTRSLGAVINYLKALPQAERDILHMEISTSYHRYYKPLLRLYSYVFNPHNQQFLYLTHAATSVDHFVHMGKKLIENLNENDHKNARVKQFVDQVQQLTKKLVSSFPGNQLKDLQFLTKLYQDQEAWYRLRGKGEQLNIREAQDHQALSQWFHQPVYKDFTVQDFQNIVAALNGIFFEVFLKQNKVGLLFDCKASSLKSVPSDQYPLEYLTWNREAFRWQSHCDGGAINFVITANLIRFSQFHGFTMRYGHGHESEDPDQDVFIVNSVLGKVAECDDTETDVLVAQGRSLVMELTAAAVAAVPAAGAGAGAAAAAAPASAAYSAGAAAAAAIAKSSVHLPSAAFYQPAAANQFYYVIGGPIVCFDKVYIQRWDVADTAIQEACHFPPEAMAFISEADALAYSRMMRMTLPDKVMQPAVYKVVCAVNLDTVEVLSVELPIDGHDKTGNEYDGQSRKVTVKYHLVGARHLTPHEAMLEVEAYPGNFLIQKKGLLIRPPVSSSFKRP